MLDIESPALIECDHDDCFNMDVFSMNTYLSLNLRDAYNQGWRKNVDGVHWYCPKHAEEHKDEVTEDLYYCRKY